MKPFRDFLLLSVICLIAAEITLRSLCAFGSLERSIPFVAFIKNTFPKGVDLELSSFIGPSDNPALEFELIPKAKRGHFTINSMGFRGDEISKVPAADTFRIAVVGDSETFCEGLSDEESFTQQLQGFLNQGPEKKKVEVLNFGVPGYNSIQECAYLEERVLPLKPDLVVLRYVFNDPAIGNPHIIVDADAMSWSYGYLFFKFLFREVTPLTELWQKHQKNLAGFYLELHRSSYFESAKKRIMETGLALRDKKIPFFVLIDPEMSGGSIHEDYPYEEIHQALKTMEAEHLIVLDPLDALRNACNSPEELWLTPHDAHKNAKGNQVMARFTSEALIKLIPKKDD